MVIRNILWRQNTDNWTLEFYYFHIYLKILDFSFSKVRKRMNSNATLLTTQKFTDCLAISLMF